MSKIELTIYSAVPSGHQPTLADVRKWLSDVDKFNLPDDYPVYVFEAELSLVVSSDSLEPILCANCAPHNIQHDVLISNHTCQQSLFPG